MSENGLKVKIARRLCVTVRDLTNNTLPGESEPTAYLNY